MQQETNLLHVQLVHLDIRVAKRAHHSQLVKLLKKVKADYPTKTVWVFTGFRLEDELLKDGSHPRCEVTDEMLSYIDVLVDGRFMKELKDISLQFRGSRNQRVIDMNKTRKTGVITIWEQLRR